MKNMEKKKEQKKKKKKIDNFNMYMNCSST